MRLSITVEGMAILWQRQSGGNRYEVRSAGRTRRLYTNGICHSDYNPRRVLTRSVWDCLFLPALFRPAVEIGRVLVLGVGGGSVIHLLQRYLRPQTVIGVELSAVHLQVAREYFGLHDVELHQAEAGSWLSGYDGPPFDFIVDDLFLEEGSDPRRAIDADADWMRLLLKCLGRNGVLSMNFPDYRTLKQSAWFTHATIRRRLPSAFALRTPRLDNAVAAFCRFDTQTGTLKQQLQTISELRRAQNNGQLRYSVRRLQHN